MTEEISGYEGMKQILNSGIPEAVFCTSDLRAIGAIQAIRETGLRVPEDVAVVGFDGLPLAELYQTPLTTIHQPFLKMAEHTVDIFNQIESKGAVSDHIFSLKGELIKRDSA